VIKPRKEEEKLTTKTQRHKENQEATHRVCPKGELGIVKYAPVIEKDTMRIGF
jgi:hypothetical protein